MPLGLFLFLLFSIFLVVTCPRPPVFARPNILVASFATQAGACILSDHNIFCTPRGGGNGGVMPLGLFLFTPPSGRGLVIPVFFFCRGQLSWSVGQVNISSTRARTNVLGSLSLKAGMNSRSL